MNAQKVADEQNTVGPTAERLARAGSAVEPVASETGFGFATVRLLDGSSLERLASLGRRAPSRGITGDQYYAGCRYYADAYQAGLLGSGVVDATRDRVDGGAVTSVSAQRIEAQSRFALALKALDRVSVHILSDVVLSETPLTVYADRFRAFPQPRERRAIALQRLRDALDQLDAHYHPPRRGGIVAGHRDGYRPVIDPAA